jgi:cation diffusion facilitator CzcD-associated flavoprotein CzcO
VAIAGAGFGGIATAVKLKRAGIDTFTIYEASLGIGGTWWDNTYPGAEVDVASHLYCFSFKPYAWTRTHAQQPELQKYLEETVDQFGLRSHLRLGATVESATWAEDRHLWELRLEDGTVDEAHVLVSAVGFLNVPSFPDWPGLADFDGPVFHTARWEHQHDLTDKVVAVVGTGSSAAQVVPSIQPLVKHLYVFQREPGWVMPKGERELTDEERVALAGRWRGRRERWRQRLLLEKNLWGGHMNRPGTKANTKREQMCRRYIAKVFADRPDLQSAVTPTYPYPGKRPVLATTFFPALKQPNVELVPKAVSRVTPTGIVDSKGVERSADVLVLATGFQPTNYLARLSVTGRDGRTLKERWAGEPRAYLGIAVPGYPNFFMLYGPGTNGGELVLTLESQAEYAVRAVKRMINQRNTAIDVRPRFEVAWNRWLDSKIEGTSWTMTNNYFRAPSGKVVTQWPYGNELYRWLTKALGRISEISSRRTVLRGDPPS